MILTITSAKTEKSSSSQEMLISLSPNDAILFRDVLPVLQSDSDCIRCKVNVDQTLSARV